MRSDLNLCFKDECAALELIEALVWPNGVVCPHCGETERTGVLRGLSTTSGTRKCYRCRKLFSVRSGTIFEFSHVPLHKWLKALFLTGCGTERIKPFQLSQAITVSFKTAALMLTQMEQCAVEGGLRAAVDDREAALPANEDSTLAPLDLSADRSSPIAPVNPPALVSRTDAEPDAKTT
jgi:hypothetical protein